MIHTAIVIQHLLLICSNVNLRLLFTSIKIYVLIAFLKT